MVGNEREKEGTENNLELNVREREGWHVGGRDGYVDVRRG